MANSDALKPVLTIDSTSLNESIPYHIGDTVDFTLYCNVYIPNEYFFVLNINGGLKIIDTTGQLSNSVNEYVTLDTGYQMKTYQLYVESLDTSIFNLFITPQYSILGYRNLEQYQGSFQYDSLLEGMQFIYLDDFIDDEVSSFNFFQPCTNPPGPIKHHIEINGRVLFQDRSENYTEVLTGDVINGSDGQISKYPRAKSPYTEVWLLFLQNGQTIFSHPIDVPPLISRHPIIGGPIENVHFAKCDDQGYFHFSFDYDPAKTGPCETACMPYSAFLFLAKENEALWLESPTEHITINGLQNRYRNVPYVRFFNKIKIVGEGVCNVPDWQIVDLNVRFGNAWIDMAPDPGVYDPVLNPDGIDPLTIALNNEDGNIFRHITLSQKFLRERLSEYPPNDPHIPYQIHVRDTNQIDNKNKHAGQYKPDPIILIRHDHCNNQLISHEYGHYFDDFTTNMFHGSSEPFAMFFSYAFRIWEKNTKGDLMHHLDELEAGPFCSYKLDGNLKEKRFGNMTYTIKERRFACYLWNIYDSKNDLPFSPISTFAGKNNDDVDDLGFDLFNFWINDRTPQTQATLTFHNAFKSQYNPILQESMDAIYDFMEYWPGWPAREPSYDEDYLYPLAEHLHWMKSPNLDFSFQTEYLPLSDDINLIFSWQGTNSYNYYGSKVKKSWAWENQLYEFKDFPNQETAVKIYTSTNGGADWIEEHTINNPNEPGSYIITMSFDYWFYNRLYYKIATIKDYAGDSYLPMTIITGGDGMEKRSVFDTQNGLFNFQQIKNAIQLTFNSTIKNLQADVYTLDGKYINNIYNRQPSGNIISIDLSNMNLPFYQVMFIRFTIIDKDNRVFTKFEKIILN